MRTTHNPNQTPSGTTSKRPPGGISFWADKSKLKAVRHPMNNYRLYKKTDIEKLIKKLQEGDGKDKCCHMRSLVTSKPKMARRAAKASDHRRFGMWTLGLFLLLMGDAIAVLSFYYDPSEYGIDGLLVQGVFLLGPLALVPFLVLSGSLLINLIMLLAVLLFGVNEKTQWLIADFVRMRVLPIGIVYLLSIAFDLGKLAAPILRIPALYIPFGGVIALLLALWPLRFFEQNDEGSGNKTT